MLDSDRLQQRANLIQAIRRFFVDRSYIEVDTPICIPVPAPEAHIEPQKAGDLFLQTSPELCMKRLLAAGCSQVFQICRCFRKNERGHRHLPEFTMLEWYRTDCDYEDVMEECEDLITTLAREFTDDAICRIGNHNVPITVSWERITVNEAFRKYSPIPLDEAVSQGTFDEIFCLHVEPHLGTRRPLFLYDYPAELASLARLKEDDSEVAERFELFIGGIELANGFSELTDAAEQRRRFQEAQHKIVQMGGNPAPLPDRFLNDLERMPPAGGIALGVDRLAMILWGVATIDEVVSFVPEEL